MNPTMEAIENLTKTYAGAHAELVERIGVLRDEQEAAQRRRIQGIKNTLERLRAADEQLRKAVDENRALFKKPRTRVMHGIKVGIQKQPGKLIIGDDAACVAALRKLFGKDDAAPYIKTDEKPIRSALETLPASDLKKCGIGVTDDVDAILIRATGGDIEKLVKALMGDAELEEVV